MTTINGSSAVVTGAANGIGRALAFALVARGCDMALADRDDAGLKSLAAELAPSGRRITTHVVDVSNQPQVEALAVAVTAAHPGLSLVFNNAGVALFGQFHEVSQDDMAWLMGINFWGVVYGSRAFLPHLQRQPAAHIVNTSSIFGIIAPPGQTAYSAAKFAVRGFSEALRHELDLAKSPVRLSVVHPGGIKTEIARNSRVGAFMRDNQRRADMLDRFETFAATTPEQAATRILEGVEANEPRILIGADARRMDILQRLKPGTYWAAIHKRMDKAVAKARARREQR